MPRAGDWSCKDVRKLSRAKLLAGPSVAMKDQFQPQLLPKKPKVRSTTCGTLHHWLFFLPFRTSKKRRRTGNTNRKRWGAGVSRFGYPEDCVAAEEWPWLHCAWWHRHPQDEDVVSGWILFECGWANSQKAYKWLAWSDCHDWKFSWLFLELFGCFVFRSQTYGRPLKTELWSGWGENVRPGSRRQCGGQGDAEEVA